MELPHEIQEYILSLIGINLTKIKRCRATTNTVCICRRKPLKNNYFCYQHNEMLLKLQGCFNNPFAPIISIVLMYYPIIKRYKPLRDQYMLKNLNGCWYIKIEMYNKIRTYIVSCNKFTVKNLCFREMLVRTPLRLTMRQYVCDSYHSDYRIDEEITDIEIKKYIITHKAENMYCRVSYTECDYSCQQPTWIIDTNFDYDMILYKQIK